MKKRLLFYSSVKSLELFKTQKFYQIDIALLEDLGYDVWLSNRIFDSLLFWKYDILFSYFYRYSFFTALFAKCFGKKTYFTGGIFFNSAKIRKALSTPFLFTLPSPPIHATVVNNFSFCVSGKNSLVLIACSL